MASPLRPGESQDDYRARMAQVQKDWRAKRKAEGRPIKEKVYVREHWAVQGWFRRFKLRPGQVYGMWESQGKACAACTKPLDKPGQSAHTHVDHCHASGKVRGVLCNNCNLALGHAKDSPERLRALAAYLEQHGS